jgi:hypothetical protein
VPTKGEPNSIVRFHHTTPAKETGRLNHGTSAHELERGPLLQGLVGEMGTLSSFDIMGALDKVGTVGKEVLRFNLSTECGVFGFGGLLLLTPPRFVFLVPRNGRPETIVEAGVLRLPTQFVDELRGVDGIAHIVPRTI